MKPPYEILIIGEPHWWLSDNDKILVLADDHEIFTRRPNLELRNPDDEDDTFLVEFSRHITRGYLTTTHPMTEVVGVEYNGDVRVSIYTQTWWDEYVSECRVARDETLLPSEENRYKDLYESE